MKIDFRTDAKNCDNSAWVTIDSNQIFNFDKEEEQGFLNTLTKDWTEIPCHLLDYTTSQNFYCYARLTGVTD